MLNNLFRRLSIEVRDRFKMEEIALKIFYSAVNAVTPHELITKNNLLSFHKLQSGNGEFIRIKNKEKLFELDITDKKIHLGRQYDFLF